MFDILALSGIDVRTKPYAARRALLEDLLGRQLPPGLVLMPMTTDLAVARSWTLDHTKSALNQLMRSFAARHADDPRTLLLLCPGWVQTELGGPGAPLTIGESIPGVVDMIEKHTGAGGLHFVDHRNRTVPW